jgi:hypothetical protein
MIRFVKRHPVALVVALGLLVPSVAFLGGSFAHAGAAGYRDVVMNDGPIAYWRLGEPIGVGAALSETGQFDGFYHGSPPAGQTGLIAGDPNSAIHLDGVDDRVTADSLTTTSNWNAGYTLEAWVSTQTTSTEGHIMAFNKLNGGNGMAIFLDQPSGKFKFHDCETPGCATAYSTTIPRANQTYYVAVTVDSSDHGTLYVNGQPEDHFSSADRPLSNGFFSIGAEYDCCPTPSSFWNGTIDEPAVYAKALTSSQVAAHYTAGTSTTSPSPSPSPSRSPSPSPSRSPSPSPSPSQSSDNKVMWIVMENQNPDVIHSDNAPYLSGTLRAKGESAANMHSESRPSLPNYLAMTTGSIQGVTDNYTPDTHPVSGQSIFSQVDPSWKVYADDMPSRCAQTNGRFEYGTKYVVRHNPAAYLVSSPINAPDSDCSVNDVYSGDPQSGALADDLANGDLPRFSFVAPGLCHDMGAPADGPSCDPNRISAGDDWLSEWMPAIFNSADYTSGRLVVFLTWDRGRGGDWTPGMDCLDVQHLSDSACLIPTLVFSQATPGGTENDTLFSHYSMLKTTEEILGLSTETLGTNVSNATSMLGAFNLKPAVNTP